MNNNINNIHIVHEVSATRYEINVSFIDNKESDYDTQYCVALVNFGECFFESNLNFIAEAILGKTNLFSSTDAVNIQNGIAKHFEGVDFVQYDYTNRRIVLG